MEWIEAKGILSPVKSPYPYFWGHYRMNLYRGCSHGCIYCDSRSLCYQLDHFSQVRGKAGGLQLLKEELSRKRRKGLVTTGSMSDPYNPMEQLHHLTGDALALLNQKGFGVGIFTKSSLVTRDIPLLKAIGAHSPVHITFTITTARDDLCRRIEPHVATTSERFKALAALSEAGIFTGVWMNPLLPWFNDTEENVLEILNQAKAHGAHYVIGSFGVTLRAGSRDYFYQQLDRSFPGMKARYHQIYGTQYVCSSPREKELKQLFKAQCQALGLKYKIPQINDAIAQHVGLQQMSLF